MIYIVADESKKIPGEVSLFLLFDLKNKAIKEAVEVNIPYYLHTDTSLYELPITSLAKLLDALTYLDDIKLVIPELEDKDFDTVNPNRPKWLPDFLD